MPKFAERSLDKPTMEALYEANRGLRLPYTTPDGGPGEVPFRMVVNTTESLRGNLERFKRGVSLILATPSIVGTNAERWLRNILDGKEWDGTPARGVK